MCQSLCQSDSLLPEFAPEQLFIRVCTRATLCCQSLHQSNSLLSEFAPERLFVVRVCARVTLCCQSLHQSDSPSEFVPERLFIRVCPCQEARRKPSLQREQTPSLQREQAMLLEPVCWLHNSRGSVKYTLRIWNRASRECEPWSSKTTDG